MDPNWYKHYVRPLLFKLDPEDAHHLIVDLTRKCGPVWPLVSGNLTYGGTDLACQVFGKTLSNPVGLAAGFDKNGVLVEVLGRLGFGFAEIGSVTALAKSGNPRPRLFRLQQDNAVINRMGLNGEGADAVASRLAKAKFSLNLGLNIAKTNDPSIKGDAAVQDIVYTFSKIKSLPLCYVTINASCPNTKEGIVTEAEHMRTVLTEVQKINDNRLPVLLKLSPDSTPSLVEEMVAAASACDLSGFVCGNTTSSRDGLSTDQATIESIGTGGLSGPPVKAKAIALCRRVHSVKQQSQIIIGCGGISSGQDAFDFISAGASLLQLYTGLIYEGPGLPLKINQQLSAILRAHNQTLSQAVGCDLKSPAIK